MNNCLIVGLYGGPGIGKSTLAAQLYAHFKTKHYDVEYVNEFAKELVYENNLKGLANQTYVFGTQLHRLMCAAEHNQLIICDSPLLLAAIYHDNTSKMLTELIVEMHEKFTNYSIFLKRNTNYHSMVGRIHSLTQSISIDNQILHLLNDRLIPYRTYDPTEQTVESLAQDIILAYGKETAR
jgi:nicotinamide riboside kinase